MYIIITCTKVAKFEHASHEYAGIYNVLQDLGLQIFTARGFTHFLYPIIPQTVGTVISSN
jgi:hypothetical protein